jgi:prepilin-type N-terminal cleavage/methylation domain-containing protein
MGRTNALHLRFRSVGSFAREHQGFTLIEVLVGVVVLSVAVIGALSAYNITINQTQNSRNRNEQQATVDQNLADVLQRNDRYSCSNLPLTGATASDNCAVAAADPGESGYTPGPVPTASYSGSGYQRFQTLCNTNTLTTSLIANINAAAVPAGINRTVEADASVPHLYWVTWTASGTQLRRLSLTPTVARWCP